MKRALCFILILVFCLALIGCPFTQLNRPQADVLNRMIGFEAGVFVAGQIPDAVDELILIVEMAPTRVVAHEVIESRLSKLNQVRLKNFLNLIKIQSLEITPEQAAAMGGFLEGLKTIGGAK